MRSAGGGCDLILVRKQVLQYPTGFYWPHELLGTKWFTNVLEVCTTILHVMASHFHTQIHMYSEYIASIIALPVTGSVVHMFRGGDTVNVPDI